MIRLGTRIQATLPADMNEQRALPADMSEQRSGWMIEPYEGCEGPRMKHYVRPGTKTINPVFPYWYRAACGQLVLALSSNDQKWIDDEMDRHAEHDECVKISEEYES